MHPQTRALPLAVPSPPPLPSRPGPRPAHPGNLPARQAHVPARRRGTVVGPTPLRPPTQGRGAQRMFVAAMWTGLIVSVWLWFDQTPPGAVTGPADALIEAGRITGMMGGYVLLVQVLLMSRVGWLERHIGAGEILGWHRDLGFFVTVLVLAHVVVLLLGYAAYDETSLLGETWLMLTTYEDMISAFVATGILVGIGLLGIRLVRAVMPYEVWYFIHLTTYAVLLLSYGHQFAVGRDLAEPGFGQAFWVMLYVFVLVNLIWGRLVEPIRLNLRHRLEVAEVVPEGAGPTNDMFSIYIRGRRLEEMRARAGQFFRWRFLTHGCWWQAHPFSLSAAPNGEWLRLTIKAVGDHTEQLRWLKPGVRVFAEGPSGVFTADRRRRYRALLIAGGSGIAPIRALLEDLPRRTVVIYRASSPDDLIFRDELEWLAEQRDADIYYVIGSRSDPIPRRIMTPRGFREIVPDISRRDVFLCGPPGLVDAAVKILRRLRVPRRQLHLDPFEF